MNLRTLKKLSKRAAPLLPLLGDDREQFAAKRDESYIGINIMARKHWERGRSVHDDCISEHEIKRPARDGKGWVYMHPPHHPRKGTIMVGATSGYYEPEWDEQSAYEALQNIVFDAFTDYLSAGRAMDEAAPGEEDEFAFEYGSRDIVPQLMRDLSTPSKVFKAAHELLRNQELERALGRHVPLGPWDEDLL